MIQKYFSVAIILISIIVVSCRQDNELNTQQEDDNSLLQKEAIEGDLMQKSDSLNIGIDPNDPPRNGTHYKIIDSLSLDEEITDPPKNGTHYKNR